MRFAYTLKQTWHHRHTLTPFLKLTQQIQTVTQLNAARLDQLQIKALALDFDGVLSPHGDIAPLPAIEAWLHALCDAWKGQIFLLSNKPFSAREAYLKNHFPTIHFIKDVAKKPYPDGLNTIAALAHCQTNEVLMIDDRLLTGILAAAISGTQALWLTPAVRNVAFSRHEFFFSSLRCIDRLLVRALSCF